MLKLNARLFTKDDLRARARRDFLMAANEISVQVRFDYVFDFEPLRRSFFQILIDITLRIDDDCLAIRPNQIRSMRQAAKIKLFEIHRETL